MNVPEDHVEDEDSSTATPDDLDEESDVEVAGDEQQDEEDAVLPLVRHHSYLPGASHPLYTGLESSTTTTTTTTLSNSTSTFQMYGADHPAWLQELAVLELPDFVLFPGATMPIRLTDREWIRLLGRQIDESRRSGTSVVRLGVLCHVPPLPTTAAATDATTTTSRILTDQQRRRSWARRGYGPTRLRRLSERLIAELGQDFMVDEDDDNPFLDRTEVESSSSSSGAFSVGVPAAALMQNQPQQRPNRGSLFLRPFSRNNNNQARTPGQHAGASMNFAQQQQPASRTRPTNGYIGRIGTIATIVFTHEDEQQHGQYNDQVFGGDYSLLRSLVVTALGTSRFRIVGFRSSVEEGEYTNAQRQQQNGSLGGMRHFLVEELRDESFPIPKLDNYHRNLPSLPSHQKSILNLSVVCPMPSAVIQSVWPWRLMVIIRGMLKNSASLHELDRFLPPLEQSSDQKDRDYEDRSSLLDPARFSYWMAANLPMEHQQKLQLLEAMSTVERLRLIRMLLEESTDPVIHCRICMTPFSSARQMFSVGGAEGTTGNYVNEHGIVHQTITVRTVDEDEVWFQGGPVAQDSWFPGYTWTIMACSVCGHHLGWKFDRILTARSPATDRLAGFRMQRLSTTSTEKLNRPDRFYGLSTANVSTFVPAGR